mmetsp:Transcript_51048/g.74665  ORF Transcript_51048/g.74665 Transcript_51048/m.74665 type:complete len:166 (+) Transcript_51048:68-565(+)|eukprot:CAMPEP_0206372564 /NCGR_PEP_ID=MMETSP0294-20121207/7186_1 /ASSEMBLY_ACC=CAM_ASM_000327 /TAXON_ID=39354 /ORGANISM="Heterosigma akashiwo, Strain CCMP2393" /LENGTH=165 /DNA_ID=CAMNT_0053819971 /DNA_START=55 /DNA_END=552 /DNA_ORIENTATION=-
MASLLLRNTIKSPFFKSYFSSSLKLSSSHICAASTTNLVVPKNSAFRVFSESAKVEEAAQTIPITFVVHGEETTVDAEVGSTLLDVAVKYDIDIEGACGGELACSTCHTIFEPSTFEKLPKKREEEDDMLDMAWGLTETSRLCCQIKVEDYLKNTKIYVPEEDDA